MGRHPHLGAFSSKVRPTCASRGEALAATGTAHLADAQYMTLSGGEKQRVVIAAALAQAGDVLLLDEPTASLDLRLSARGRRTAAASQSRARRDDGAGDARPESGGVPVRHAVLMREAGRSSPKGRHATCSPAAAVSRALRRRRRRLFSRPRRTSDRGAVAAGDAMKGPRRRGRLRCVRGRREATPFDVPSAGSIRTRLVRTTLVFRRARGCGLPPRAARRQHAYQPRPRLRSVDSVRRQRRRADLLHRPAASGAGGALVGAALAAAGVVFQAMLRNPLATPFTLGVSSGASLGAMLAITLRRYVDPGAVVADTAGQPRRRRPRGLHRLLAGDALRAGDVDAGSAARRASRSTRSSRRSSCSSSTSRTLRRCSRAFRWLMGDLDVGGFQPIRRGAAAGDRLVRHLRAPALGIEPAEPGQRCRRRPRRGRGARAAARLHQRIAGDERRGLARRPHRLHRHRRAASGPADGRRRPPPRPAGVRAVRCRVSGRLRRLSHDRCSHRSRFQLASSRR